VGDRTTLNQLHAALAAGVAIERPGTQVEGPIHASFREGDVRHSLADIGKAQRLLHYRPTHTVLDGLKEAIPWYVAQSVR
jgi:UDP-N-acetylglucosamine 4-epimerase